MEKTEQDFTNDLYKILAQIKAVQEFQKIIEPYPKPPNNGWLVPYIYFCDDMFIGGRWSWWMEAMMKHGLPERPMPKCDFLGTPDKATMKHYYDLLNVFSGRCDGYRAMEHLLDEMAYAIGCWKPDRGQKDLAEAYPGAREKFAKTLNLPIIMQHPYDYFGDMIAEIKGPKNSTGFFPTPMTITDFMTRMMFGPDSETQSVFQTVNDPCVGTGRFLLSASNYSVRLYGCDIDPMVLKACKINAAFYVPWLIGGDINDWDEVKEFDKVHPPTEPFPIEKLFQKTDHGQDHHNQ